MGSSMGKNTSRHWDLGARSDQYKQYVMKSVSVCVYRGRLIRRTGISWPLQ